MKNFRPHFRAETSADKRNSNRICKFRGTNNPRQLRVLKALLKGPVTREMLDKIAGCSNGPGLVAELRQRGLDVPCTRLSAIDRDGRICYPGMYWLTPADHQKISRWMAPRGRAA